MNARDMQERRAILIGEMRQITTSPAGSGGDLSDEQSQKFDALKAELEGIEKRLDRQRVLDEAERRMQGTQIAGSGDDKLDDELRSFSLRRAIASMVPDLAAQVDCGRERELSQEIAKRAGRPFKGMAIPLQIFHKPLEQRVITGSSEGDQITGTDHRGDLYIDALRARMVTRRLGARIIAGLVGNLDVPKLNGSVVSGWVADNSALSADDPDFTKVQLTPKHAGCLTEFSRSVLLQSSPDVEMLLRDDFAQVLAQTLDIAAINGGGSNEPSGVLQSGLSTVSFGGGATWEKVLQIIEAVEEGNADAGAGAWVTTPAVVRLLRSTLRAASTDSRMIMEAPNDLAGYRLEKTQNAPRTLGSPQTGDALIFGDWRDVLIGFWSELDLLTNPYESTAYSKGNVQVRGMMTCDVAVRHSESFAASTDVQPG